MITMYPVIEKNKGGTAMPSWCEIQCRVTGGKGELTAFYQAVSTEESDSDGSPVEYIQSAALGRRRYRSRILPLL